MTCLLVGWVYIEAHKAYVLGGVSKPQSFKLSPSSASSTDCILNYTVIELLRYMGMCLHLCTASVVCLYMCACMLN